MCQSKAMSWTRVSGGTSSSSRDPVKCKLCASREFRLNDLTTLADTKYP